MSTPSLLNIPYLYKAGTLYSQIPESGAGDFTVQRTTTVANRSTRINKDGFIETVLDNVPRLDYPLGGAVNGCPALLVEPAATNGIRNNSMVGAVAGTPGTLPTGGGWSNILIGLTQTIVGVGTENGIAYIDIRFSGTATSTNTLETRYESPTQINASNGQTWTHSVYLKKIADPNPPIDYELNIYERTSGGSYVANGELTIVPTTTIQRFTQTRTLSGGGTVAKVQPALFCNVSNGQFYDFTIRIGYPQMELGSVATSVIPTTTAAVTRSADVISDSTASALIGQSEGTIYAEVETRVTAGTAAKRILTISNGNDADNRISIGKQADDAFIGSILSGGVAQAAITSTTNQSGSFKIAFAFKANDAVLYINGTQIGTDTSLIVPSGLNRVDFGQNAANAAQFNDRIRAVELHPNRLSNAQLAALTAP